MPQLPLNQAEADKAIKIFNRLKLPDVRGTPTLESAGGDWFRDIVRALFGAVNSETHQRFIRGLFLLAPKKSAKTTYGAALMVTALLMNTRPRAELLLIAPTKMIADLAFSQAVGMVEEGGFLRRDAKVRMHVQEHVKQITDHDTGAQLKIKSFDASVLTGVKPIAVLIDELHEIAKSPDAPRVIGQLRGGLLPNPESFMCFITTQSDQPPAGAFRTELNNARGIRDGRIKGDTLPILYEFPDDMVTDGSWRDPETWPMVTPNLDLSVTVERLKEDYARAQDAGDEEVRRWASQHLNVEVGLALRIDGWVGATVWEERGDKTLTLDAVIERSEVLVCGADGGGLADLLGFAVLGRDARTREWLLWTHAWAHDSVLSRYKSEASRLRDFEAAGDLTIVSTLGDDIRAIGDLVERVNASGKLAEKNAIGIDPAGIGGIMDEIVARGIDSDLIVGVSQGWRLNGAIKTAERKLADGTLTHSGQAMMAWCASNAKTELRGNAVLVTKAASGAGKIDPLVATFCAVSLMSMNPQAGGSVYSANRGLLIVSVGAND